LRPLYTCNHRSSLLDPSEHIPQSLHGIRVHYRQIRRHFRHADAHVPFFRILIEVGLASEAVDWWCRYIQDFDRSSPYVFRMLWDIILAGGAELSQKSRWSILGALQARVGAIDHQKTRTTAPNLYLMGEDHPLVAPVADAVDVVDVLNRYLCGSLTNADVDDNPAMRDVLEWMQEQFLRTCCTELDDNGSERWSVLVLFALASSQSPLKSFTFPLEQWAKHIDFRVVIVLSIMEQSFGFGSPQRRRVPSLRSKPHDTVIEDLQRMVRKLWALWVRLEPIDRHPSVVDRAVLSSFLRLSGLFEDTELLKRCGQYIEAHRIWLSEGLHDASQIVELGCHWLVASTRTSSRDGKSYALARMVSLLGDTTLLAVIASRAISSAKHWDPLTGYQILLDAQDLHLKIPDDVITALGVVLAVDHPNEAAMLLLDSHLSEAVTTSILSSVLRAVSASRVRRVTPHLANAIMTTLSRLSRNGPILLGLHGCVEFVLSIMPASGQSTAAVALIEMIHKGNPVYFRPKFLSLMTRHLLLAKEHELAINLVSLTGPNHPQYAVRWHNMLARASLRQGVSNEIARRILDSLPESPRPLRPAWRRALKARITLRPRPASLHLARIVPIGALDDPLSREAFCALLRAGRLQATRQRFKHIAYTLSDHQRTTLGNQVLHGYVSTRRTRNRRHVRRVLWALGSMVAQDGVIPDRVTVNILIKATLLWTKLVDSAKLRRLFDHLVACGYGMPSVLGGKQLSNGSDGKLPTLPLLPNISGPISFAKHLRPMYRLFVKAFRIRGDHTAAKVVVRMLNDTKREVMQGYERRERARFRGRMLKARGSHAD
jgi:hypothetical protein